MMNSASHRILLVSVLIFLAGYVRAELTAPAHRFFNSASSISSAEPLRCGDSVAPGLDPSFAQLLASNDVVSFRGAEAPAQDVAAAVEVPSLDQGHENDAEVAASEVLIASGVSAPDAADQGLHWLLETLQPSVEVVLCDPFAPNELDRGMSLPVDDRALPVMDERAVFISAR